MTMSVVTVLLDSIGRGQPIPRAARRVGLHPSTVYKWLQRGEADESFIKGDRDEWPEGAEETLHLQFFDAVKKAEGDAEYRHLQQIEFSVDKWQASAWWLERKYPDDWGLKKDQFPVGSVNFLKQRPDKPEDALDPALVDDSE